MRQRVAQARLMQVCTSLMENGDEGNTEAASPVSRQVGEARGFVVLTRRQIGIRHDTYRDKEERIAKALNSAGQSVVEVIRLQRETAVVPHGTGHNHIAEGNQLLRAQLAGLHQ